jgi:hypothetical protein
MHPNAMRQTTPSDPSSSEFLRSLVLGVVLGGVALIAALPWIRSHTRAPAAPAVQTAPAPAARAPVARAPVAPPARRLADFHGVKVSRDVRQVANWSFFTGDNAGHSVVILDKKAATAYVFDPAGRLVTQTPVLLGLAIGDGMEPGIGDKPLSQIRDDEKTTPAGRFVAQLGENDKGEDIVWIDYDAALAMHRVVTNVPAERRVQRLASPDPKERRISFGCINLPPSFYDQVLSPTVKKTGAIVYVLPEIETPQQVFGSWDVTDPSAHPPAHRVAQASSAAPATRPPRAYRESPAALAAGQ